MQSQTVFGVVGKVFLGLRLIEIWLREARMMVYAIHNSATTPWGEGESLAALISDRIALNDRSAAMVNGASEVQKVSATVPSSCGRGSGRRPEETASVPQAG